MPDTELMVITPAMTAVQLFAPGKADEILAEIERSARSEAEKLDASTETGRTAIKSLAYKVKRTKTATDKMRLELVAEKKKALKLIDQEGARMWDRLESLEKEIRKPVTDLEELQAARVKALEDRVAYLDSLYQFEFEPTIEQIAERLDKARNADMENRQEFDRRLLAAQKQALTILEPMLAGAQAKEAARLAEIERQKAEAERLQKEREEAAAARAKADAEERARKAAEEAAAAAEHERVRLITEAAEREAKLKADQERAALAAKAEEERIERQAREREEKAAREAAERERQAEYQRQAAEARAKEAERQRVEAEAKAKRDAEAAAKRAEEEKQAAVRAEQKRQEDARKAEEEAQRKREANKKRREKINGEIRDALVKYALLSPEIACQVIFSLSKNEIPHVRIEY